MTSCSRVPLALPCAASTATLLPSMSRPIQLQSSNPPSQHYEYHHSMMNHPISSPLLSPHLHSTTIPPPSHPFDAAMNSANHMPIEAPQPTKSTDPAPPAPSTTPPPSTSSTCRQWQTSTSAPSDPLPESRSFPTPTPISQEPPSPTLLCGRRSTPSQDPVPTSPPAP